MTKQYSTESVKVINALLIETFELKEEKLIPSASIYQDLGLDSIDAVDLAVSFNKKFDIELSEDVIHKLRILEDIYELSEQYKEKWINKV